VVDLDDVEAAIEYCRAQQAALLHQGCVGDARRRAGLGGGGSGVAQQRRGAGGEVPHDVAAQIEVLWMTLLERCLRYTA
jgi:hypothetical protein